MFPKSVYAPFVLVCSIFGTTFLAIRLGLLAGASPVFFAGTRFLVAGVLLLGVQLAARKTTPSAIRSILSPAAFISLFLTAGTFGCMFWAETRIDSGSMARLDSLGPIVAALLATGILRHRSGLFHVVGFAAGTVGAVLLAQNGGAARASVEGTTVALVSVVLYALGMVLYPKLFRPSEDAVTVNALQMAVGGIILLVVSPFVETVRFPLSAGALLPLAYLIVVGSIIGHTANLIVVRRAGPVFASAWLYVAPPIATVVGALVLGETVGIRGIAGMVFALAGVFFVSSAESRARTAVSSVGAQR